MKPQIKVALACAFATALSASSSAQTPVYAGTVGDYVTGDNAYMNGGFRYWDVDAGSDSYQWNFYERPTVQSYELRGGRYSAEEYFEYLDITEASIGFDSQFLYVAINLFGLDKSTKDGANSFVGLKERYGFSFSLNEDGRNGILLVGDQPGDIGTTFSRLKTFGYKDVNGDVGGRGIVNGGPSGLGVTRSDNNGEEGGMNGYEHQIISDGRLGGQNVLFQRVSPKDNTIVEFALDYGALGLTASDIISTAHWHIEAIKGGPKDPQNYHWNDKYFNTQAGSPIYGAGGLNEFGTNGLGNIYELDTLQFAAFPVPEPGTFVGLGLGGVLLALRLRRRR
jgi:hypothetical protein